jgi:hypothetical protein
MNSFRTLLMVCVFLAFAPVAFAADAGAKVGTVAETIESGGYVYMKLEDGQWIAANYFPVATGDKIQYSGAMEMNNFHSNTLDRTFESILFVSAAGPADGAAADADMPAAAHGGMGGAAMANSPAPGEVKPLDGGKTVAAIFAESGQLKGQVVGLNAKVVKVSNNIMGKNWVTLQDGTGTEPADRLMATTQETVEPGALVTVRGTVNTDVDLGYGYLYKVLLEEASFTPGLE